MYVQFATNYLVVCICLLSCLSHIISHTNSRPMMRCKSAPDLKVLYNDTMCAPITDNKKNLVPYSKYKAIINNRYRRNIYLRSKEKYTLKDVIP
jgi:hypothetical protein